MKTTFLIIKILIAVFLGIAIGVHVYGFFGHISDEGPLSHTIHLISYSLCLFAFLRPVNFRLPLYCIGAIYPVAYHANCFFTQLFQLHKFNSICFEVIVILPLAAVLIFAESKKA